jgi:hypothetical protein
MDPVSVGALLAAIAGGAGGALGSQVWEGLSALVRRPFRPRHGTGNGTAPLTDGSTELAALQHAPADEQRAVALAEVLIARADADSGFRDALQAWWDQASRVSISGDAINTVSGGTQRGPVLQGRDFSGLTFMDRPGIIGGPCLPDKINLPGFPAERSSFPHILSGAYTRMRSAGARCYTRRPILG